jgi:hypothetical protein
MILKQQIPEPTGVYNINIIIIWGMVFGQWTPACSFQKLEEPIKDLYDSMSVEASNTEYFYGTWFGVFTYLLCKTHNHN